MGDGALGSSEGNSRGGSAVSVGAGVKSKMKSKVGVSSVSTGAEADFDNWGIISAC